MRNPKCYECGHRRDLVGSAHSRCVHPKTETAGKNPLAEVKAIFASVGRMGLQINVEAAIGLGVIGNPHGIRQGWFNWPWNFDPTWLESCNGFEQKEC